MEPKCITLKRIWEVDCISMDAALASSFDWRDLINILHGAGVDFKARGEESQIEIQVQNLMHQHCHSENSVSLCVEGLLNLLHEKILKQWKTLPVEEIAELAISFSLDKPHKLSGFFWALGTDPRPGLDCIRRRFHQRFQVHSIRRLTQYPVLEKA